LNKIDYLSYLPSFRFFWHRLVVFSTKENNGFIIFNTQEKKNWESQLSVKYIFFEAICNKKNWKQNMRDWQKKKFFKFCFPIKNSF
jgi:hypothetical protein